METVPDFISKGIMSNHLMRIIMIILLVIMVLYLSMELTQPETPPILKKLSHEIKNNIKKKVSFNENVKIKEIPNLTKKVLKEQPQPVNNNLSMYEDNEDETWETAFKGTLLDSETKKLQNKINTNNQSYRDYNLDHNLIMNLDTTIPYYPKRFDKEETKGKTIKSIYDNKVANIKPLPKKLIYQSNDRWEYLDESTLNGGLMNKKGLTGNDNTIDYGKVSFEDEFVLENLDPFVPSRRIN